VDSYVRVRVDAAGMNVAQQDQHQEPELRPVMRAFRFQGHHRAAGIIGSLGAMFGGQIACQSIEVASCHPHAGSMTGSDEQALNRIFT